MSIRDPKLGPTASQIALHHISQCISMHQLTCQLLHLLSLCMWWWWLSCWHWSRRQRRNQFRRGTRAHPVIESITSLWQKSSGCFIQKGAPTLRGKDQTNRIFCVTPETTARYTFTAMQGACMRKTTYHLFCYQITFYGNNSITEL